MYNLSEYSDANAEISENFYQCEKENEEKANYDIANSESFLPSWTYLNQRLSKSMSGRCK